nr:hypothetical protein [Tanacetum cinerariifolium]
MVDNRTMAQLLQAPTEGYEDAIVIPEIAATNFELKHGLINLVQNKQFFGHDKEDPHAHHPILQQDHLYDEGPKHKKNQYSALAPSHSPAPIKAVEPNCVTYGGSGTLPGNTITNPKEDLKGITTRSGVAYQGPTIHTLSKVAKQGTEVTKDQVQTSSSQSTAPVQPSVVQSKSETPVSKPVVAPVNMSFKISFTDALILMPKFASTLKALIGNKEKLSEMAGTPMNKHCSAVILNKLFRKLGDPDKFLIPCEFPGMDECLALADLGASINLMPLSVWKGLSLPELNPTCMTLKLADRSVSKPIGIAKDVSVKVGVIHFPANFMVVDFEPDPRIPLILERCFLKTGQALIDLHKDVTDEACEEYSQEVFGFSDVTTSGSPTLSDDPIVSTTSPRLTSFGDSDFLLFEEADAFLGLEDDPDSPEFDPSYYDLERDILLLEAILNSDPSPPLLNHEQSVPSFKKELKACEAKTIKSSIDEPLEVELKDLPPHLEYAFLEGDNKLPVIIAKELEDEEKSALIKVLKSYKRAIAWKLSDIQGINPEFCTHKILMEEDYKPAVQHQRRVNPKIHDVIKKRCMLAIFHDMVEKTMEVFMDDFSVFGNSCWELNVRSIPTSSAVFPLPVMRSHCQKKFPLLEESSHCQKKFPLIYKDTIPQYLCCFSYYHTSEITQCVNHLERSCHRIFNKCYQSLVRSFDLQKNKISSTAEKENDKEKIKLKNKVETLKEEKDVVDGKLARLLKSSKELENIIESQRSENVKEGLGYNVVPSPAADLYRSPKKDLSWTGLSEFADDIVTDYSRPSPTVESTSAEGQNKNSTTAENGESTDSILSKPAVKFVKAGDIPAERPTTDKAEFVKAAERPTTDKVETAKKPAVRYAEMYRRTSKRKRVQRETTRSQNHAYMSPSYRSYGAPMRPSHRPAGHRPHGPPIRPQYRAPWVPTVNKNFPPVNRKLPTGNSNVSTICCYCSRHVNTARPKAVIKQEE